MIQERIERRKKQDDRTLCVPCRFAAVSSSQPHFVCVLSRLIPIFSRRIYSAIQDGPLPLTPTPSSGLSILTLITKNTSVYNLLKGLNPYYYPALDVRVGFRAGWDVRPRTVVWLEIHTLI